LSNSVWQSMAMLLAKATNGIDSNGHRPRNARIIPGSGG
jgi:hypothetical protein